MSQPLNGVRVVELATGVAGCYAGKLLADFGAAVVKVEPPEGDVVRHWGPFPGDDPSEYVAEQSALHLHLNTNKRSIVADVAQPADRELITKLIASADIVLESFRPGLLSSVDLGWETLHERYPSLVLTSITPFGQDGPYADWLGAEIITYAMGGPMHATGLLDREPLKLAGHLLSYQSGAIATLATLGALMLAEQTGVGSHVDVASFETQAGSIDRRLVFLQQYLYNGHVMQRDPPGGANLLPSGIYPAGDGWVQVSTPPTYAERFVESLGDPDLGALLADPNWMTNPDVPGLAEAALYGWLAERTATQAMVDAQVRHWTVTELRDTLAVVDDEHLRAREFFVDVEHPRAGRLRQAGAPWRMKDAWAIRRAAPLLDEHRAEVLDELASGVAVAEGKAAHARAKTVSRDRASAADRDRSADALRLPLGGVRVLDLTVVWAGPYTTMLLGDLGAEVIRVENAHVYPGTRGAVARPSKSQLPSLAWLAAYPDDEPGERPWNRNAFFNLHARNKTSISVDLRRPDGVEAFLRLVDSADVFIENNSLNVVDKLGIGWDVVHRRNPRLIMVRMPALGLQGPMASYVGFGASFEALCGLTSLRGYLDSDPSSTRPVYYMDAASGAAAASAVLLALRRRDESGLGELVEFAQCENMLNLIGEYLIDAARARRAGSNLGNRHLTNAPQGAYRCAGDDRWVVISVASDAEWREFAKVMGSPSWALDARFSTAGGRRAHHDELDRCIESWTSSLDRWDVTRRCQAAGVAAGPVLDEADLARDPHLRARGFFRMNRNDDIGWREHIGHLWHWTGPALQWKELCPFAAGNDWVWREIGRMSDSEIAQLTASGHLLDYFMTADGKRI